MNITIPQISNVSFNKNYLYIQYDNGESRSVPFNDNKNATIDLGNLNTTDDYGWNNFTCDCCKQVITNSENKGLHYSYIKFERNICKHCLVVALDKMLGLDINGKSEQVLFQK